VRVETHLLVRLVSYGNAYVRGAITKDELDAGLRAVKLVCCRVDERDAIAWLDGVRTAGGTAGLARDLSLEERIPGAPRGYQAALSRQGTDSWRLDCVHGHATKLTQEPSVADATRALDAALDALVVLGTRHNMMQWTGYFEGVLANLRAGSQADWRLVASTNVEVRALATAAAMSDVFAGMGSWNDFYLDDAGAERERDTLSGRLYDAMRGGLRAAASAE